MPREGAKGSGFRTGSTGTAATLETVAHNSPCRHFSPGTLALPVKLQRHTLAARDLTNSCWHCRGPEGAQHCVDVMGFGPSLQLARIVCVWLGSILLAVTAGLLSHAHSQLRFPFIHEMSMLSDLCLL